MRRKSYADPPVLTKEERLDLQQRLRSRDLSRRNLIRASIVLMLAGGAFPFEIGAALNVSAEYVRRWRRVFVRERIAGLFKERRVHPPRKYPADVQSRILLIAGEPPPQGARRWTATLIAKQLIGVDRQYVMKVIRRFGIHLRPRGHDIDRT